MGQVTNHGRAEYINIEPHEAKAKGYDLVSLKYDGIWCRLVGKGNKLDYFSRDGRLKTSKLVDGDPKYDFELIGEYMFGTEWAHKYGLTEQFYAFDMYRLADRDLTVMPYLSRLDYMAMAVAQLPDYIKRVFLRSIVDLVELKTKYVDDDGEYRGAFEGFVFARSYKPDLSFGRWKKTFTLDCTVIDFIEGKNRLTGTLGALIVRTPNGLEMKVGGGMTDRLRNLIWSNRALFKGATIEVEGKALFASGKLRHPNLSRFHADKNTTDVCVLLNKIHERY